MPEMEINMKEVVAVLGVKVMAADMPPFMQLDVRIDKRFLFKSWILSIYLDVSNVTNHGNVEGYAYSYDYTRRQAVTGLPILPSVGVRASF